MLFHTSYQTDHKTSSLGFDYLVTHVGAAPYGNTAGSVVVECLHNREDVCDLISFFLFVAKA